MRTSYPCVNRTRAIYLGMAKDGRQKRPLAEALEFTEDCGPDLTKDQLCGPARAYRRLWDWPIQVEEIQQSKLRTSPPVTRVCVPQTFVHLFPSSPHLPWFSMTWGTKA